MEFDALIDDFQSAWSARSGIGFEPSCASDVHYEDPLTAEPLEGIKALTRHARRLHAGFPDARVERSGQRLTDRRFVAAPCRLLATNSEELEGLPATKRFVTVHVLLYCELTEDRTRLLRVRAFFDLYNAAVQLGVLPKSGTLGEKALLMLRGFGLRSGAR